MILTCPACATRYRVDQRELGWPGGRAVRCANCGHAWHQAAPVIGRAAAETAPPGLAPSGEPVSPPAEDLRLEVPPRPPLPSVAQSDARRRGWSVRSWAMVTFVILLVVLVILAGVVARRHFAAI